MRRIFKVLLALFVLMFWGSVSFFVGATVAVNTPAKKIDQMSVWQTVQKWRSDTGKTQYTLDDNLCYIASSRAIQVQSDWSHSGFENEKTTWFRIFPQYHKWGENLAQGLGSPDEMLNAWLNSPAHRQNLEADYTNSCIRCVEDRCVQIFTNFQPKT